MTARESLLWFRHTDVIPRNAAPMESFPSFRPVESYGEPRVISIPIDARKVSGSRIA